MAAAGFAASSVAVHAGEVPLFANVPDWVVDSGPISATDAKIDGLILLDRQEKIDQNKVTTFSDVAFHATSVEQLANLVNVTLTWHPDKGDLTVHRLQIIRDGAIIDVTKGKNSFTILRREQNLERQWINGILTATMQVEGLKVGDILRMTTSISFTDAALSGNVENVQSLIAQPAKVAKGSLRVIWPQNQTLAWRVTTKDAPVQLSKKGGFNELVIAQPLPKPAEMPKDAPLRFTPPPFFEASSFANWRAVSKSTATHYETEGLIAPGSALAERVASIAAASTDPKLRAAAALRMVQDDVRYLFNGQTQGNYVPQKPAETWEKRYGDCKAKTLLLVAMLRSLGIEVQPALVSSQFGDLLPGRLPSLGAFDHVIARADIDGKTYWLDGTMLGTRLADLTDPPAFRYALPLSAQGSDLEPIPYAAPARPLVTIDREIDATAGISLPKLYSLSLALRNNQLAYLRQAQGSLDTKKLNELIDQVVQGYMPNSIVTSRSLTFDDAEGLVRISAEGISNLNWWRDGEARKLTIGSALSDFSLDADRARPAWKDMAVKTAAPSSYESHYRIRLPKGDAGFVLEHPKAVTGEFAGFNLNVVTRLESGLFTLNDSYKAVTLEFPAAALSAEREKIARAKAEEIALVAPESYPPAWREQRAARANGLLKPLEARYAAAIAQDPEDATPYINRARYYTGIDDKPGAIADLTKVIALQPDVDTYLWRAGLLELIDSKKALADIAAARAIDPASVNAVARLVHIYFKQRRYQEALSEIEAVLPLQNDRTWLLVLKAEALARAGRATEGVDVINKASLDKPGNASLLNGRCWVRAIANIELDGAIKDCTKAIELTEEPAGILDSRGLVYLRMQRYDDAIADLDAAIRLNPGQSQSLFVRGVARTLSGKIAEGQQDIQDARVIQPDVAQEYAAIGVVPKP